ncbi:MAG: hypothetical protein U0531_11520 [Dehalococcoidia bacterium]
MNTGATVTYTMTVSNIGGAAAAASRRRTRSAPGGFVSVNVGGGGFACAPTGARLWCSAPRRSGRPGAHHHSATAPAPPLPNAAAVDLPAIAEQRGQQPGRRHGHRGPPPPPPGPPPMTLTGRITVAGLAAPACESRRT